ncbi:hypothetical protein N7492_007072 [Penicillium capsulatum]|uniref:Uncharacterized protein n=1 Tax=Penicillium capsulatum TaxID=69766 RepID=A0A9W9I4E2_9EURO|nr:hypothetical protein N7492_007072 [Penicillium capsulatum]KAJ6116906.1 hypothetical protein N7512_006631 [Penicillium capsulatum]
MHPILTTLILSTPIHAATTARVWTHFYPSCPGDPFTELKTYENYEETVPSINIHAGQCTNIAVPSYERNLVSAISVDAEIVSHEKGHPFPPEDAPNCNITLHEVPGCSEPPLINKELHNGVEVSPCESRRFAAYSEVWVQLVCDDKARESLEDQAEDIPRIHNAASAQKVDNVQTPGSNANSWSSTQAAHSERQPEQEGRVNMAGHAQSEQTVRKVMEMLKNKHSSLVSGKHNATQQHLNRTLRHGNATFPANRTVSRRKLSVLRNRATRLY